MQMNPFDLFLLKIFLSNKIPVNAPMVEGEPVNQSVTILANS